MGRKGRMLIDGGIYHITSRGHNRYRLFHDYKDYNLCKDIIRKYKAEFSFELFHYCLMPNHIHLLLRILHGNELPRLLQCLNQGYARYYKSSYGMTGNLFQGRYKSIFIDKDAYLLDCGRYVERNPYRAGIVKDPSDYYWSSCRFYTKGRNDDIITADPLYIELSQDKAERMRKYTEYLLEDRPYEHMVDRVMRLQGVPI
jgi:putative transposase